MSNYGIPNADDAIFIMIDIQEKFMSVIHDLQTVIDNSNRLINTGRILDIPLIVTEQYPKGLGKTIGDMQLSETQKVIEKLAFDCFGCEEFVKEIDSLHRKNLIIFGIEAHVCVLQTCISAICKGYEVHVISDAISSRTENNKRLALNRMAQSGIFIASTEMIIFQLTKCAGTEQFRQISKLVK
jgi:isochorismate hydrolase